MVDPIGGVGGPRPIQGLEPLTGPTGPSGKSQVKFEDVLRDSIRDVDRLQHAASDSLEDLSIQKTESVAEVMTAVEKADIAFRTLMQVRNKLVEAYEELLRIRV